MVSAKSLPNESSCLIDVLRFDGFRQWGHRFVILVRVPGAHPPWSAILGKKVIVKCGHRPICYGTLSQ